MTPPPELRDCARLSQNAQNERDAALYTTKPKPLDGNLLRKLFKATMEEKKRASEDVVVKSKQSGEVTLKKDVKPSGPQGFYIPPGVGTPRSRVEKIPKQISPEMPQLPSRPTTQTTKHQKAVSVTPALSVKSEPAKTAPIRISGIGGEEAFIKIPLPLLSVAGPDIVDEHVPPVSMQTPALPDTADEPSDRKKKKKTKKTNMNKNNKKKQQKNQEKDVYQAGVSPESIVVNEDYATDAPDYERALMSGALSARSAISFGGPEARQTASSVDLKPQDVLEVSPSLYVIRDEKRTTMQPTVESAHSRVSSKASKAPKARSTRAPSVRTVSTKQSSLRSFEEIGEAWAGPVALPSRSAHSAYSAASQVNGKLDQQWVEPDMSVQKVKRTTPSPVPNIDSQKSSRQLSPRIEFMSTAAEGDAQLNVNRTHTLETDSCHISAHYESHCTPTEQGSDQIPPRDSSRRHSSTSRSSKQSKKHGTASKGVQEDKVSQEALHLSVYQDQLLNSDHVLAREQEARGFCTELSGGSSQSSQSNAEAWPVHHLPLTKESRDASDKHSMESLHSSSRSHRHSRHASTRNFSTGESLWEKPSSTKSSARSGSQPSSTHRRDADPEYNIDKHSAIRSAIGSVVSMISKARSELTFEEVGEGWLGGVSSEEVKENNSEARCSSRKGGEEDWDQIECTKSKRLRADTSSRHRSSVSTHRKRHGDESNNGLNQNGSKSCSSGRATSRINELLDEAMATEWNEIEPLESNHPRLNGSSRLHSSVSTHRDLDVQSRSQLSRATSSTRPSALVSNVHTLVGAPIHAVVSSVGRRPGVVSSQDNGEAYLDGADRLRKQRPTVFAGRGWITPHPLESSIAERAPAIVLPRDAVPHGATLSYEAWKAMQEDGIRNHRNFSITESNVSERERHKCDRYRFSGWESRPWLEVEPASLDPNVASTHQARKQGTESETVGERSSHGSSQGQSHLQRTQRPNNGGILPMSSSERLWERMEEGDAWGHTPNRNGVLSDRDSG